MLMVRRSASFYLGFETLPLVYAILSSFLRRRKRSAAFNAGGLIRQKSPRYSNRRLDVLAGLRFGADVAALAQWYAAGRKKVPAIEETANKKRPDPS
jgi:hypothetical protein